LAVKKAEGKGEKHAKTGMGKQGGKGAQRASTKPKAKPKK
jgi:hypothetical protein